MPLSPSVAAPVPERVAYPAPVVKWAKHPRKRCLACRVPLQGRYYLLDQTTWTCVRCGAGALSRNEIVRGGS